VFAQRAWELAEVDRLASRALPIYWSEGRIWHSGQIASAARRSLQFDGRKRNRLQFHAIPVSEPAPQDSDAGPGYWDEAEFDTTVKMGARRIRHNTVPD